jgi:choline dehydrogenase-like flavoprotein
MHGSTGNWRADRGVEGAPAGSRFARLCVTLDDLPSGSDGRAAARAGDVVVVGGGTFGAVLATELHRSRAGGGRVIVLERGPVLFADHVQNLPTPGLHVPPPTYRELALAELEDRPRHEVWRLPWRATIPYAGLAACVGGRSLYWGAFSPQPCSSEMAAPGPELRWPSEVVEALEGEYFARAATLLGLDTVHAHYLGRLSTALTRSALTAIEGGELARVTPLAELPDHPAIDTIDASSEAANLQLPQALEAEGSGDELRTRRYSSLPRLADALAEAAAGDGAAPALAVVPSCHVARMRVAGGRVVGLVTEQGELAVDREAAVVLAAGTVESTRLALLAGAGGPVGTNLTTHMRSNLMLRAPRSAVGVEDGVPLGGASILVRCREREANGPWTHFHHQVTAFGLSDLDPGAQLALLHMSPRPDVEQLVGVRTDSADHVVICISGVAQMESGNGASRVTLSSERDEHGVPRALVAIDPSPRDLEIWDVMDESADELGRILVGGAACQALGEQGFMPVAAGEPARAAVPCQLRREPLGTGHHELGTLRMGRDEHASVTDPDGRLWTIANAYAVGPAVFPSLGSSSPVMPGVALTLRLADHLAARARAAAGSAPVR